MDYYIVLNEWASIVRRFKEAEKVSDITPYDTERLAREILSYVRYTRIKQWPLFTQQRGEEYERMVEKLRGTGFDTGAVERMLADEEFWSTTLEVAEY